MARKFLIVTIAATLGGSQYNHQVYAGTLVIAVCLMLQVAAEPYTDPRKHKLEVASLVASAVSLYGGLLFSLGGVSTGAQALVALVIIGVNVWFIGWCVWVVASILYVKSKRARRTAQFVAGGTPGWLHRVSHRFSAGGTSSRAGGVDVELSAVSSAAMHGGGAGSATGGSTAGVAAVARPSPARGSSAVSRALTDARRRSVALLGDASARIAAAAMVEATPATAAGGAASANDSGWSAAGAQRARAAPDTFSVSNPLSSPGANLKAATAGGGDVRGASPARGSPAHKVGRAAKSTTSPRAGAAVTGNPLWQYSRSQRPGQLRRGRV